MTLPNASGKRPATLVLGGLMLFSCLAAPPAHAQATPAPAQSAQPDAALSSWDQLSQEQRDELIGPLRERWNSQPQVRARLLGNARRWREMNPEQRLRAQKGLERLEQMTPEQRQQAREAYQRAKQLPEAERQDARGERTRKLVPQQRRQRRLRQR